MTKHVLIVSLRLRLTFDTHRYAYQTSRRPDLSGMCLVCACLDYVCLARSWVHSWQKCQLFYFWEIGGETL